MEEIRSQRRIDERFWSEAEDCVRVAHEGDSTGRRPVGRAARATSSISSEPDGRTNAIDDHCSNAVIGIMAPQPLAQVAVLFGDAQMQVMPVTSTEPRRASSLPVPLSAAVSCTGLQVGRVQSPLPCFPSTVLFPGVSLFSSGSHRSGSPPSQILRRRYAIRCLRFTNSIAAAHARLASGWLASLCREGV